MCWFFSPSVTYHLTVYKIIFKGSLLILPDAWDNIQQLSGLLILLSVILQVEYLPVIYLIKQLKHLAYYTPDIWV